MENSDNINLSIEEQLLAKKEHNRKKALEYYYRNKDKILAKNKINYQNSPDKLKYFKVYQQKEDYKQKKVIYNKKYYEQQRQKLKEYEEFIHKTDNTMTSHE